jgi:uncharacterized protein (DUF4415 family)
MRETVVTKGGMVLFAPTPEEDARITAAALSDPDCPPMTDADWANARPFAETRRPKAGPGRPPVETPRQSVSFRFPPDLLAGLRALGKGWQTRAIEALRRDLAEARI